VQNVLIVGSGPAGAFLGSRLIENETATVTFVVRPERKRQLLTEGLIVASQFGRFRRPVHALTYDEVRPAYDVIVVACRAQHYETSLALVAEGFGPGTILVPLIEGAAHFGMRPIRKEIGQRLIGAVFEGRIRIDADGRLRQRPPEAELYLGALDAGDEKRVAELAALFAGRGLKTSVFQNIRGRAFERFAFLTAAVATSALSRKPFRDALRYSHAGGFFTAALKDGFAVGKAVGFDPEPARIRHYERAFSMEGHPVDTPLRFDQEGSAANEAIFLVSEMIDLARRYYHNAGTLNSAWEHIQAGTERELLTAHND
jgi:2-dehydropantoate 2-reductase